MSELRKISLEGYELFGGGATSETYYSKADDTIMLKVFIESVDPKMPYREFEIADKIYKLGIKTPRTYEMVDVEGRIGIIFQRVKNKISCARLMGDHPELIPEIAKDFVREVKTLHSIKCDTKVFKSRVEVYRNIIENSRFTTKEQKEKLLRFLDNVEYRDTCVHGDLQMGNLIKADGQYYWIDLGDVTYGHPLFDIAGVRFASNTVAHTEKTQELYHMTTEQLYKFWDQFLENYIGGGKEDKERFMEELNPYLAVHYTFLNEINNFIIGGDEVFQEILSKLK